MDRNGISVDWITGFGIFLVYVILVLLFAQQMLMFSGESGEEIKYSSVTVTDSFRNTLSQEFKKLPVRTKDLPNYPVELNYPWEETGSEQSVFIDGIPAGISSGKSIWTSDGREEYTLWYSESPLYKDLETDLTVSDLEVSNDRMTADLDSECDIQSLNTDHYYEENIDTVEDSCEAENGSVYVTMSSGDETTWRFYRNSSMFRFFGDTVRFNTDEDKWKSAGSSGDINHEENNLIFSNETTFIDLYSSGNGIAALGNFSVKLYDNGDIEINNREDNVLFYPHEDDYTVPQEYTEFVQYTGFSMEDELITYNQIRDMRQRSYSQIKQDVSPDWEFKVRFKSDGDKLLEKGELPDDGNIVVTNENHPVYINGSLKQGELYVAIWK